MTRGWFNVWRTPGLETWLSVIVKWRCISHSWDGFCTIGKSYLHPKSWGHLSSGDSGSPSKFSFLWRALFLVHTHKQSQGCRHWISRLCHRVASGSGQLSCAASAYISMWKAKAVPNIPSKHLSCLNPAWKNSRERDGCRMQLLISFCHDKSINKVTKCMFNQ